MHKIYEIKEMLCDELEQYGDKESLDMGSLDVVDKLAHAIKNLDKIIESYEEDGYSERGMMYDNERGYARNRYSRARKRDSMGRYSRKGDLAHELRELMDEAPETTKHEFKKLIAKVEGM